MSVAAAVLTQDVHQQLLLRVSDLPVRIRTARDVTAVDDKAIVSALGVLARTSSQSRPSSTTSEVGQESKRLSSASVIPASPGIPRVGAPTPMRRFRSSDASDRAPGTPAGMRSPSSPNQPSSTRWVSSASGSSAFTFGDPTTSNRQAAGRSNLTRTREARRTALFNVLPSIRKVFARIDELMTDADIDRLLRSGSTASETDGSIAEPWIRFAATATRTVTKAHWVASPVTPDTSRERPSLYVEALPAPNTTLDASVAAACRVIASFFTMVHRQNSTSKQFVDADSDPSRSVLGGLGDPAPSAHLVDVSFRRFQAALHCFMRLYEKQSVEIQTKADKLLHSRRFLQVCGSAETPERLCLSP
jgi:hypothetical protein